MTLRIITQKTQRSIILRYVTNKSELVERFFGFHDVSEDRTAEGLFYSTRIQYRTKVGWPML